MLQLGDHQNNKVKDDDHLCINSGRRVVKKLEFIKHKQKMLF